MLYWCAVWGGGALLLADKSLENEQILLEIKILQEAFDKEDSLKKRTLIQQKIDTLKKQYTDNVLSNQDSTQPNSSEVAKKKATSSESNKPSTQNQPHPPKVVKRRAYDEDSLERQPQSPKVVKKQAISHKIEDTLKAKQSGFFLAISGGGFERKTIINVTSYLPINRCYHGCEYLSNDITGGGFFKLGVQKMHNEYFGERFYLSGGQIGSWFWTSNSDVLIQFPIGSKVALGFYGGVGIGFLWNSGAYEITYGRSIYSIEPRSELALNVPAGISLAFGHSRIELGYFALLGILAMYKYVSTSDYITAYHHTHMQGITLSYQYTF